MVILNSYYIDNDWSRSGGSREYAPERYMLAHSRGVEYAKRVDGLDFSVVDPFHVWSVNVDYEHHQACIALVLPRLISVSDTSYAVGVEKQAVGYVDGAAFVPGVIRAQLVDFASQGEYDVYGPWVPCGKRSQRKPTSH
jgi:hypothetical protein